MKHIFVALLILFVAKNITAQIRTIHVFVALCDNEHQGIVPVPAKFGNGKDPDNNLYWGAAYGLKGFLKYRTSDWELLTSYKPDSVFVLERLLFKHTKTNTYLLADAYDGEQIMRCTSNFLKASNGQAPINISTDTVNLQFGGKADLLAYTGHNGLMDFDVEIAYTKPVGQVKDVIILACASKNYFAGHLTKAGANPILWTTNLMAPETYTLKAAIDGWIAKEAGWSILERAAKAYNKYQKCGLNGARRLFATGF